MYSISLLPYNCHFQGKHWPQTTVLALSSDGLLTPLSYLYALKYGTGHQISCCSLDQSLGKCSIESMLPQVTNNDLDHLTSL
jgi:hypothetical protein